MYKKPFFLSCFLLLIISCKKKEINCEENFTILLKRDGLFGLVLKRKE